MRNVALEAPRLELCKFIKRSNKEMIGFSEVAQIEKSNTGCNIGALAHPDRRRGDWRDTGAPAVGYI